MRVSSSAAVRSNAGYEARSVGTLERRVGHAPVDELGSRRERGADLANAVAQGDHRCRIAGSGTRRGAWCGSLLMSSPYERRTRTAFGMQRLRVAAGACGVDRTRPTSARAAPRRSATAHCCRCTGTTPAVDDASSCARGHVRRDDGETQRRVQRGAGALQRLAAGGEVDRVVAVAAVRRAAPSASPDRHRGADAGGTTPGSAARRPAPSTPARSDRSARAPATTATAPGATPAVRTAGGPRCSRRLGES